MTVLPELGSLSLSWCSDQLRLCCLCLHWSDLSRLTWRDLMVRPWQQSCTSFPKVFSHEGHYSNAKGFLSSTCLCAQHDWARTNGSRKLSQFSDQYDQHGIKLLQSHTEFLTFVLSSHSLFLITSELIYIWFAVKLRALRFTLLSSSFSEQNHDLNALMCQTHFALPSLAL